MFRAAPQQTKTERKTYPRRGRDRTRPHGEQGRRRIIVNPFGLAMALFFVSSFRAIGFWLLQIALRSPLGARGLEGKFQNPDDRGAAYSDARSRRSLT